MPKPARPRFGCSSCGNEQSRWFGRCPACGAWNTAVEGPPAAAGTAAPTGRARWRVRTAEGGPAEEPRPLAGVASRAGERASSGLPEMDRVLGKLRERLPADADA